MRTVSFARNLSCAATKAAVSSNAIFSAKLDRDVSVHPWDLVNAQPCTQIPYVIMTEVVLPVWARRSIIHLSYRSAHQPGCLDAMEDTL